MSKSAKTKPVNAVIAVMDVYIDLYYHQEETEGLLDEHWSNVLHIKAVFPRQHKPEPVAVFAKPIRGGWLIYPMHKQSSDGYQITCAEMEKIVKNARAVTASYSDQQADDRIIRMAMREQIDRVYCPATRLDNCHPNYKPHYDDVQIAVQIPLVKIV